MAIDHGWRIPRQFDRGFPNVEGDTGDHMIFSPKSEPFRIEHEEIPLSPMISHEIPWKSQDFSMKSKDFPMKSHQAISHSTQKSQWKFQQIICFSHPKCHYIYIESEQWSQVEETPEVVCWTGDFMGYDGVYYKYIWIYIYICAHIYIYIYVHIYI